ncbi:MAG: FAD-dependent oxidoreductase [Trueperaceae bacterium]|nr:FAD-dependent oxidoreductase [Trueperaceae bacterium]
MDRVDPSPLCVAIVGAGPSGLFAADALLKTREDVRVDVFDRLPTPYGLVRYGVAPDHHRIKSVTKTFERTCRDPRVRYFGNVAFGEDITLSDLRKHAHAVILAVGANSDRSLGVDGEELEGSMSATEFVAWYNGHPDYVDLEPPLRARSVAVVGVGNVAVDVARILAKSVDALRSTDIADHALEALAESKVEDIHMLGRRGPAQAKWTTKELRELGQIPNADVVVDPAELELDAASAAQVEEDAPTKKNMSVLRDFATHEPEGRPRRLHLHFFVSPVELRGQNGRVREVVLARNRLEEREGGYLAAVDTGARETLPASWVLRSVGYRGEALPDLPFDARRGVVPNDAGRVLDENGQAVPGTYVAGWIKRGPTGVIGTNKADAMETVRALLADPPLAPEDVSDEAIPSLLASRGVEAVDFDGWLALDRWETRAGEPAGRPRVKVVNVDEMLQRARADD